jgi:hypothetical protein
MKVPRNTFIASTDMNFQYGVKLRWQLIMFLIGELHSDCISNISKGALRPESCSVLEAFTELNIVELKETHFLTVCNNVYKVFHQWTLNALLP